MPNRVILFWVVGLFLSVPGFAQAECRGFRDCYDTAEATEREGNLISQSAIMP